MLLGPEQIDKELKKLSLNWTVVTGNTLNRVIKTESYRQGVGLVVEIAKLANEADHHPDVRLSYSEVEINLTTHSESGLTQKDFDLAKQIDQLNYSA